MDEEQRAVHLLGVPAALLLASRDHHDDVLREFRLLAVTSGPEGMSTRFVELIDLLGRDYSAPLSQVEQDADRTAARQRADRRVDLAYDVASGAAERLEGLSAVLDEVDELCERGELITLPRTPLLREFQRWALGQVQEQLKGKPPRPWSDRQA